MWKIERLGTPLCVLALGAIAVTGCGSGDDGGSDATDPDSAVTVVDTMDTIGTMADTGDTVAGTDEPGGTASSVLTIEGLCDPLDDVTSEWIGGDVERQHLDLFAADDPASLTCEWRGAPENREVRVTYHASPSVWDATVASGGAPLDAVEADNRYDGEILSVHADNGWTVDVVAFEGDPPDYVDAADVLASIANAALAAAAA